MADRMYDHSREGALDLGSGAVYISSYTKRKEITSRVHVHNAHACYPQEKWPIVCMTIQGKERSISAAEQFI